MILLQVPSGGSYVDYDFYTQFESFEASIKAAYTEVLGGIGNLGDVTSAIAAIAATLYIGFKILRHLSYAEPVDVWPLLRPFALGFMALNFTLVTDFLGAIVKPVESVTKQMVDIQTTRIQQLENMRNQKIGERMAQLDKKLEDLQYWQVGQYLQLVVEKQKIYMQEGFDTFLKNLFYALFLAARLVVITVRAFFMLILTIIGPLAFAAAIFTGFQDSHLLWIARYVQISLWLSLANVLGTIITYLQGKVVTLQYLELVNDVPDEAQSGELIYVVFMIIATLSYFTVPTIASYIISSSGVAGALQRVTSLSSSTVAGAMGAAGSPTAQGAMNAYTGALGGAGNVVAGSAAMTYGAGAAAAASVAAGRQQAGQVMHDAVQWYGPSNSPAPKMRNIGNKQTS